jgi:hypothetical protein
MHLQLAEWELPEHQSSLEPIDVEMLTQLLQMEGKKMILTLLQNLMQLHRQ